jgi:hypothetical protein
VAMKELKKGKKDVKTLLLRHIDGKAEIKSRLREKK